MATDPRKRPRSLACRLIRLLPLLGPVVAALPIVTSASAAHAETYWDSCPADASKDVLWEEEQFINSESPDVSYANRGACWMWNVDLNNTVYPLSHKYDVIPYLAYSEQYAPDCSTLHAEVAVSKELSPGYYDDVAKVSYTGVFWEQVNTKNRCVLVQSSVDFGTGVRFFREDAQKLRIRARAFTRVGDVQTPLHVVVKAIIDQEE